MVGRFLVGGLRGVAGGVEPPRKCVQLVCEGDHHVVELRFHLVLKAPAEDGGMVAILLDQFSELPLRKFKKSLPVGIGAFIASAAAHKVDKGNFSPRQDAVPIAQPVKVFRLRIVRKPNGGSADVVKNLKILIMLCFGQRVTESLSILMAAHAAQGIGPAVEQKTLFPVDVEIPQSGFVPKRVDGFSVYGQLHRGGIEIWILTPVPKMRVVNLEVKPDRQILLCCDLYSFRLRAVPEAGAHMDRFILRLAVFEHRLHPTGGGRIAHLRGDQPQPA